MSEPVITLDYLLSLLSALRSPLAARRMSCEFISKEEIDILDLIDIEMDKWLGVNPDNPGVVTKLSKVIVGTKALLANGSKGETD